MDNLLKDVDIIYQKVMMIFRKSTKHANFWLGMQFPLKSIHQHKIAVLSGHLYFIDICTSLWLHCTDGQETAV